MKFRQTVCFASYSIIHFGDDFYIWSRREAKYQMRHALLTGNNKVFRKKKKKLASHEKDLRIFTEVFEYLQSTCTPQQLGDLKSSVSHIEKSLTVT